VPALRPPPPPRAALPIAIKFAFFIAVLVVLIMVWQTFTAMRVAQESQDIAINESGVRDVCALGAALDPTWIETSDPQLRSRLKGALEGFCAASRELGVLNAMVYSPANAPLATGKPGEEGFVVSQDSRSIAFAGAAEAGVEIHELEYNRQPVRVFSKVIQARRGASLTPVGRVEVLLSALRIEQSRVAVRDRMIMVTATAAGVAALLSFILAAYLTYPIRTLARDLRQVSMGHFDHQTKVRSGDETGDLARAFNHMTSNLLQAQETLAAQKAMEHELNLATRIQTRLLPAAIPDVPGFDIAAYYRSAREVGGDYYDFLRIGDEHLGVVVADVSGKGVPGSLVMTMTRALLRMAAAGQTSPAATIDEVNGVLAPDLSPGMFVTLVYLVLH
ncbi:MAG: PP2C family protein-serine/threonine phosphatase, partial [Thermoanaerobaculia bacterium]